MKLIQQSVENFTQTKFDLVSIYKQIEKCARITYKSEDKITDTSYEKFVHNLVKLHHDRPLEFGTVHLKMTANDWDNLIDELISFGAFNQIWIKDVQDPDTLDMYITTNYRYYLYIKDDLHINISQYFTEEDNEWFPTRYTFKFITNRAIMDEFRTHVGLSHLAESTRWCNYSKDKFGNDITFICPSWIEMPKKITAENELCLLGRQYDNTNPANRFLASLVESKYAYLSLLDRGCKPQEARDVFPLAIKSELVSCGFTSAWDNFICRRTAKDAHPMAQELSNKVKGMLISMQLNENK